MRGPVNRAERVTGGPASILEAPARRQPLAQCEPLVRSPIPARYARRRGPAAVTSPPPPPIRTDAVVVDLRRDAPPPPGRPAPSVVGDGNEMWIRIDLDDPATPSLHAVPPPVDRDPPSYPLQLIRDEPIPLGLRRVSVGLLDAAVAGLRGAVRTTPMCGRSPKRSTAPARCCEG